MSSSTHSYSDPTQERAHVAERLWRPSPSPLESPVIITVELTSAPSTSHRCQPSPLKSQPLGLGMLRASGGRAAM